MENTTPPQPSPIPESPIDSSSGSKKGPIAIIAIVVLLIIAGLGYLYVSSNNAKFEAQILTLEQAKTQSDSTYQELKKELANYKKDNQALYAQVAQRETELEKKYSKIQRLISQAKRDKSAKKEIDAKLKALTAEVESLRELAQQQSSDLAELEKENKRLQAEKDELAEQYKKEQENNEELKNQTEKLEDTNKALNDKIDVASVLQTANVTAKALKLRSNGDAKQVQIANRAEFLEACFEIAKNEVVEAGPNRFYLRIVDPTGTAIIDKAGGSGSFPLADNGQAVYYTTEKAINYDPGIFSLCIRWKKTPDFQLVSGKYRMELYNKGYQVGRTDLTLK
ncbi:MAG: hypothetical protein GY810_27895 [Aureispira sp.]|nr:hypothetical protein [Aureispira sp.]